MLDLTELTFDASSAHCFVLILYFVVFIWILRKISAKPKLLANIDCIFQMLCLLLLLV